MSTSNFQLKFAGNISTLFGEVDMLDRFKLAKQKGFSCIEAQLLYDHDRYKLQKEQINSGLDVVLINSPIGIPIGFCYEREVFGLACIAGMELDFLRDVHQAIQYATALNCKQVHILGGLKPDKPGYDADFDTYVNNINSAASILEEYNITTLIEPMSSKVKPNYYLDCFDMAKKAIDEVENSNVKLLLDVFHMHMMGLDVISGIKKFLPYTGHIQVSQAPLRNEPLAPGEIDYNEVFDVLKEEKYSGYIGLEYTPSGPTGFDWLKDYGIIPSE